jgi:hypothetical protein
MSEIDSQSPSAFNESSYVDSSYDDSSVFDRDDSLRENGTLSGDTRHQFGPRNRYFSQITLTNRIYLFNSAEYLTESKTVACKQVQNFRPPRSFDFQLRLKINLRKQEKSFQRSD